MSTHLPPDLSGRPLLATADDVSLFINRHVELDDVIRGVGSKSNVLVLGVGNESVRWTLQMAHTALSSAVAAGSHQVSATAIDDAAAA